MENNNQRSIDLLNQLVEVNNDRIAGYEHAAKETNDATLKSLFLQMAGTSRRCREELAAEINKLGGEPTEGTAASGKLYRLWMDFKAALTNKDRRAVLSSCEFGEDAAVRTYQDILLQDDIRTEHTYLLKKQFALIKAEHDKVKNLRDASVTIKTDKR